MKPFKSLVKNQQKVRAKRKQVLKELSIDHPEVATKLKKLEVKTMRHKDGKRHVHTVPVKLQHPQNDLRKTQPDDHLQWHPSCLQENLRIYLVIAMSFPFSRR